MIAGPSCRTLKSHPTAATPLHSPHLQDVSHARYQASVERQIGAARYQQPSRHRRHEDGAGLFLCRGTTKQKTQEAGAMRRVFYHHHKSLARRVNKHKTQITLTRVEGCGFIRRSTCRRKPRLRDGKQGKASYFTTRWDCQPKQQLFHRASLRA